MTALAEIVSAIEHTRQEATLTERRYLTVVDVAEWLDVTRKHVVRWIESGALPAIDVGGRMGYRIAVEDVHKFLAARRVAQDIQD